LLRLDGEERRTSGDGWKEFTKNLFILIPFSSTHSVNIHTAGTYTYPISIALPGNSPRLFTVPLDPLPTISKHKCTAHPQLTAVREVEVILYPVADDAEEHDRLLAEHQWEGQMAYVIPVLVRMFCIGETACAVYDYASGEGEGASDCRVSRWWVVFFSHSPLR
jgi:hypothetical protein